MGRTVLLLANLAAAPFAITLSQPPAYGLWALIQAILPLDEPREVPCRRRAASAVA
jgi:hypothetical protein